MFQTMCKFLIDKCPELQHTIVYPWRVYTQKDIDLYSTRHANTTSPPKQYKRKVISTEKKDMNKTSIALLLDGLQDNLLHKYSVVFVHKAYPNATNPTHRYINFI